MKIKEILLMIAVFATTSIIILTPAYISLKHTQYTVTKSKLNNECRRILKEKVIITVYDCYGNKCNTVVEPNSVTIISPGYDEKFDTKDDIKITAIDISEAYKN